MTELLTLFRDLILGHGTANDIGIRFLLLVVGALIATLSGYLRKDFKKVADGIDTHAKNLHSLDRNIRTVEESFFKHKKDVSDILMKNTETFRSESHALQNSIVKLEGKLQETSIYLEHFKDTKEDVTALVKDIVKVQVDRDDLKGRIFVVESFANKYEVILKGIEKKLVISKNEKEKK